MQMKKQCGIPCARTERGKAFVKALFVPNLALLHCIGTVSLTDNRLHYLPAHSSYQMQVIDLNIFKYDKNIIAGNI